jgi:hypothetical protein
MANISVTSSVHNANLLNTKITNQFPKDIYLLRWNTPFDPASPFANAEVRSGNGDEVPYIGIRFKRGNPTASEYILLKQGETKEIDVDLGKHFQLTAGPHTFHSVIDFMDHSFDHSQIPRIMDNFESLTLDPVTVQFQAQ